LCGLRGGIPYKDAARIEYKKATMKQPKDLCYDGTIACSEQTSAENTICVKDLNLCPITYLDIIDNKNQAEPDSTIIKFKSNGKTLYLAFNKVKDRLPIIRS